MFLSQKKVFLRAKKLFLRPKKRFLRPNELLLRPKEFLLRLKKFVLRPKKLILGILIAVSFTNGYNLFLDNVLYVFLVLSMIFPIYYSEFILGFILGMTYTFGAILPTIFILIIAAFGFLLYKFIRLLILRVTKTFAK